MISMRLSRSLILGISASLQVNQNLYRRSTVLTFNTGVADEQVKFEILATWPRSVEQFVGHAYLTLMTSGALSGCQSPHVRLAADVAVLRADTSSVLHATVDGVRDDDHLVVTGTSRLERLPLTVLTQLAVRRRHLRACRQHCAIQCT